MDKLVGKVLPAVDDKTLLLICSDHGFAQFARQFHLNTWLRDNGYLVLKDGAEKKEETSIFDVDWSQTVAYGIGFNGLYLNLKGREGEGIVDRRKRSRKSPPSSSASSRPSSTSRPASARSPRSTAAKRCTPARRRR